MLKNILAALDRKERKRFFILVLLDMIISIFDVVFLALLLWIIQLYIQPDQNSRLLFLPGWLANRNSTWLIAVFVVLFAIKNMAGFAISRACFKFINKVAVRISGNSLRRYQEAGFREFVNIDSSVHLRTIGFRPFEFSQYMLSGFQQIITQSSLMLISIIAILLFNAKIFLLLLLILLPPVILVFWFVKKRLALAKSHIQTTNERSFQHLLDALKAYVESNIYNRNDFFQKRFIDSRRKFSTHLFESMALQTLPGRVIEIFAVLGLFILVVIAQWTGNNDSAMLITIGAFMAAAYKIIPGIVKVINISGQMKAYESSLGELDHGKAITEPLPAEISFDEFESIMLKNVSFNYAAQPVLKNFSLEVKKGDFVGITGSSGKGKTTILNLMLGFLPTEQGEVLVNNKTVSCDDIKKCWPLIAYTRQQGFFIYDTVLRNITLEETGYKKEDLNYALNISGLEKVISQFPEGLDKMITENGKNISGGQQQRISIARALYKNASLILLDEPFNELDEASTHSLLEHFKGLAASGKTVVMITHDKNSLSYCTKIVSLDEQ